MGNDKLLDLMKHMMKNNPYMQLLNMEIIELQKGHVKGKMKVEDKLCNPYGSVHGGCLYSLADVISGTAASTYGYCVSTISGQMNFIRPAMNTEYVFCDAQEIRQGKQVSVYRVELTNDEGTLLEDGSFSFFTLNKKIEFFE